jgi:hypothetical protein
MYSALLLEDFWSNVKSQIQFNKPVSTFIAGMIAGLHVPGKNPANSPLAKIGLMLGSGTAKYVSHKKFTAMLDQIEVEFHRTFAPIVSKFTTPIDKVVRTIKDGSVVGPNSKLYSVIQFAATFLFLFLGFTTTKVILLLLGKENKKDVLKQYKRFALIVLLSFMIAIGASFWNEGKID